MFTPKYISVDFKKAISLVVNGVEPLSKNFEWVARYRITERFIQWNEYKITLGTKHWHMDSKLKVSTFRLLFF